MQHSRDTMSITNQHADAPQDLNNVSSLRLIFVRHGQDDESRRGGWSRFGLTTLGIKQARDIGLRIRQFISYPFALISSDLNRARETCDYIEDALETVATYDDQWREINNGDLAGMLNAEANVKYPGLYFSTLRYNESYSGGESPELYFRRIESTLLNTIEYLVERNLKTGIVVTHGGCISIVYHILMKIEWSNASRAYLCLPGQSVIFECKENIWTLKTIPEDSCR
ncbi:histidine phosphatase family protein [Deinococcus rubellus]|uniref:histidine phosphatase family protein n=1 Tax=Deinococcus rubellus TaxID=1889240 RepID=UPI0031EBEDE2